MPFWTYVLLKKLYHLIFFEISNPFTSSLILFWKTKYCHLCLSDIPWLSGALFIVWVFIWTFNCYVNIYLDFCLLSEYLSEGHRSFVSFLNIYLKFYLLSENLSGVLYVIWTIIWSFSFYLKVYLKFCLITKLLFRVFSVICFFVIIILMHLDNDT